MTDEVTAEMCIPERLEDQSEELARTLDMAVEEFVEIFGADWWLDDSPIGHDYDSDPSGGMGMDVTPWHIAGSPPQLMLRVFGHGVFIAAPEGRWDGVAMLGWQPNRQSYVARWDLETEAPAVVKQLLTWRRRTFRYCRYCRTATPPELRYAEDICVDCAGRHHNVVF